MFYERKETRLVALVAVGALCLVLGAGIVLASQPGNLACDDLTGCKTEASCGGPGTPNGCVITCDNGTVMTCPQKVG